MTRSGSEGFMYILRRRHEEVWSQLLNLVRSRSGREVRQLPLAGGMVS